MPEIWEEKEYVLYYSEGFEEYMKELGNLFRSTCQSI